MIKSTTSAIGYICNECGKAVTCEINFFERKNEFIKASCSCGKSGITLKIKSDNKVRLTVPCILCGTDHIYNLSLSLFFKKEVFRLTCSLLNVDICALGNKENISWAMRVLFDEINRIFMMYAEADVNPYEKRKSSKKSKDSFEVRKASEKDKVSELQNIHGNVIDILKDIGINEEGNNEEWYFDDEYDDYDDEDDEDFLDEYVDGSDFQFHAGKKNTSSENSEKTGEPIKLEFKDRQNFEKILFCVANLVKRGKVYCECLEEADISMVLGFDSIVLSCKKCGSSRTIKAATSFDVEYFTDCDHLFLD